MKEMTEAEWSAFAPEGTRRRRPATVTTDVRLTPTRVVAGAGVSD